MERETIYESGTHKIVKMYLKEGYILEYWQNNSITNILFVPLKTNSNDKMTLND